MSATLIDSELERGRVQLRDKGYLIVKGAFSPALQETLRREWLASAAMNERSTRFLNNMTDFMHGMYRHPELLRIVQGVYEQDLAVYFYRLMCKDERWSGEVPPHQEAPYFHGGLDKLMCFIPLGPMNRRNGGLYLVEGSHKYGSLGRVNDHEIELDKFPNLKRVYVDIDLGDIILHNYLLWHGSDAAIAVEQRPLFHVLYQPSRDGSHYGQQPVLAAGEWKTQHFLGFKQHVFERDVRPRATLVFDSLRDFVANEGHCFIATIDRDLPSDANNGTSHLVLLENGKPLAAAHAAHADIRQIGEGRYSHWGQTLYLSTSDNSDPRSNGRLYSYCCQT